MKMRKFIVFIFLICFFILILGIAGFQRVQVGDIYMITIIFDTMFFIISGCLLSKKTLLRLFLITFSIGVSLFTGTILEQILLDKKMDSFDINGDGIFGEAERTEEQQLYFERAINDTNVLFRYVMAFPYAFFSSIVGIPLFNVVKYLLRYIGGCISVAKSERMRQAQ